MHEELKQMIAKRNPFAEEMAAKMKANSQNTKPVEEKPAQVKTDSEGEIHIDL